MACRACMVTNNNKHFQISPNLTINRKHINDQIGKPQATSANAFPPKMTPNVESKNRKQPNKVHA